MSRWGASLLMIVAAMVPARTTHAATEDVNALQARFDRETNSVHKARLLEKLGDAQLELTRRASQTNDYKTIGFVMEKYRDNARAAVDALKKDHRDAEHHTNGLIKLFLTFADDRLKKFQYELQHPSSNKHPEMLNALMNAYIGCVDDAADLVQLGIQKQENIRPAIDLMASRAKEFLQILEKLSADGTEIDIYKDNLDDAIEGTRDAMNAAEKAKKALAPPPVTRKNYLRLGTQTEQP